MHKNILRIAELEDKSGYKLLESGCENSEFLLVSQSYAIRVEDKYMTILEKVAPFVRFGSIRNDLANMVKSISADLPSSKAEALKLIRADAKEVLEQKKREGYILEDLTDSGNCS